MSGIGRWLFGVFIFAATGNIVHVAADGHEQGKAMILTSESFKANGELPVFCTCDGPGVSPPLQWKAGGPPSGRHRYYFKLYALDTRLPDRPALTKGQVEDLMKKHVIGSAELMGTYKRK